jgi:hypothetical protein
MSTLSQLIHNRDGGEIFPESVLVIGIPSTKAMDGMLVYVFQIVKFMILRKQRYLLPARSSFRGRMLLTFFKTLSKEEIL